MSTNNYTAIPILERTDTIINLIASQNGISAVQLLENLKLPKTTLYRILNFLSQHGYIFHNPQNNLYYIGNKFYLFCKTKEEQIEILKELSVPYLHTLANSTSQTAKLNILSAGECLVIAKAECKQKIKIIVDIGSKFPLHAGASSKILLSSLPDTEIQSYFALPVEQYTDCTITSYSRMKQELEKIKQSGYAIDNGEFIENICAIACPIFDATQNICAAVSIAFPGTSLSKSHYQTLLEQTKAIAKQITQTFVSKIQNNTINT